MRRDAVKRNALSAIPDKGYIEIVQNDRNARESVPQFMPVSLLNAAAPPGKKNPVIKTGPPTVKSGAGTISVEETKTDYISVGVNEALVLPDADTVGQVKRVLHSVAGGNGIMTPSNFVDGTQVDFVTAGEQWEGMWTEDGWATTDTSNIIDGVTSPIIS